MLVMSTFCKRLKRVDVDPGDTSTSDEEIAVVAAADDDAHYRGISERSWAVRLLYTAANHMVCSVGEEGAVKALHVLIVMIERRRLR